MPHLHLGVIELPYVQAPSPRQKKVTASTVTTGDVASWLEDKYDVMQHFVDLHEKDMAEAFADSMAGALENLMMGGPVTQDIYGEATSKIERMFKREFLEQGEMDKLGIPGVPTQAAKDRALGLRRSARMKTKRKSNAKAVSFIDSGLYESAFKAWVEG